MRINFSFYRFVILISSFFEDRFQAFPRRSAVFSIYRILVFSLYRFLTIVEFASTIRLQGTFFQVTKNEKRHQKMKKRAVEPEL